MPEHDLVKTLLGVLRHRDSPLYDWTIARTIDGHIATRAPSGECFTVAVIPIPEGGADALWLADMARREGKG